MRKYNFNFIGNLKKYLIISGALFLVGVIASCILGVKRDVSFAGGSRFTYTFTGTLDIDDCASVVSNAAGMSAKVSESKSLSGNSTKLIITLGEADVDITAMQESITVALQTAYPDNNVQRGEANTVSATIAGSFFKKALVATFFSAFFVLLYIGIRFKNIGGVSAGVAAFACLIHDCILAFISCVIFGLEIDVNFIAVILTILGYSLNDTIVIYDRIRENRRMYSDLSLADNVNKSINETLNRSLFTAIATFIAVLTVTIVAEIRGLTSLRNFTLPMLFGIVSGCYSTICLGGPLWVVWKNYQAKRKAAKNH